MKILRRDMLSDSDEVVYLVDINYFGQSVAYKLKMEKHQLLRFKPYYEIKKTSADFEVDVIIG